MKRETTLLITSVLALLALGVVMVYSASTVGGDARGLLHRQLAFLGLGAVAMCIAAAVDYRWLRTPRALTWISLATFAALILVLIPGIGVEVGGARRWIRFPGFGFQPSELGKFTLVLLLAVYLAAQQQRIHRIGAGIIVPGLLTGVFVAFVFAQRDIGIPFIMGLTAVAMMFAAGANRHCLAGVLALAACLAAAGVYYAPHRLVRIIAFWDPWKWPYDEGFQLIQSLTAFAQGGLFGRGFGGGEQKLFYLPAAHTDFIFAVIGEDAGLIGTLLTVLIFAALLYAAIKIAMNAPDLFGSLLAFGITMLIVLQAIFIMFVTTGMAPTKGLPLPFVSYGGTALIVYMAMAGILVNIGAQINPKEPARPLLPARTMG